MPYDDRVPQNLAGGGIPAGGRDSEEAWKKAVKVLDRHWEAELRDFDKRNADGRDS